MKFRVVSLLFTLALAVSVTVTPAAAAGTGATSVEPVVYTVLTPDHIGAGDPAQTFGGFGFPFWGGWWGPWFGGGFGGFGGGFGGFGGSFIGGPPFAPYFGTGLNLFNLGLLSSGGGGLSVGGLGLGGLGLGLGAQAITVRDPTTVIIPFGR
jgi:hypothetical protein